MVYFDLVLAHDTKFQEGCGLVVEIDNRRMLGSCTYPKAGGKPPKKHVLNKWRTAERLLFSCRLSFIRFLVHIPNLPWKVSHELQVIDLSLSGNPNLQEVSCVLGLQS
jgi:hypothetical protein